MYRQQGTVLRSHLFSTLEALNLLPAVHEVPNHHAGLGLRQDKQRAANSLFCDVYAAVVVNSSSETAPQQLIFRQFRSVRAG